MGRPHTMASSPSGGENLYTYGLKGGKAMTLLLVWTISSNAFWFIVGILAIALGMSNRMYILFFKELSADPRVTKKRRLFIIGGIVVLEGGG